MKQNTLLWILVATNCVAILLGLSAFALAQSSQRETVATLSRFSAKWDEETQRQRAALSTLVSDTTLSSITLRGIDGQAETLVRSSFETQNILKAAFHDPGRFLSTPRSVHQRLDEIETLTQRAADTTERLEGAMRELELQTTLMESSLSHIRMAIR